MSRVPYQPDPRSGGASSRQRGVALALTIVAHLLLLLLLLRLAPHPPARPAERRLVVTFPLPGEEPQSRKASAAARPARTRPTPRPLPPRPKTPPPITPPTALKGVLFLSREEMAAADVRALPRHPAEAVGNGAAATGSASADTGRDARSAGQGLQGQPLYYADWYRRPTNAELSPYLAAARVQQGWGEVACRTAPRFQVEDCQELGESPAGSGLARAVREAAWQFRVLPPRLGGRALVGSWVRIRITNMEVESR